MRILHLLNHTARNNGHVHVAVDLACEQRRLGHEVAIASGGGDFDALLRRHGVETFDIDHRRRAGTLLRSSLALRRLMRRWRPDVVHAHMMTSAVLAWMPCKLGRVPLVTTVHNEFERGALLMGLGTRVIAVSEAVGDSMNRRGIPRRKLRVVLNGTIGSARQEARAEPVALRSPSVLFVGGLHPRKGLPDLLTAFETVHRAHPAARLHIVGDGPHAPEYRDIAAASSCAGAVFFEGSQADPSSWMRGADIFVLPSLADPAPLVLSEAREAGCAVVATAVDGIPQMLGHGEAGLLVPPQAPQRLAQALLALLDEPSRLEEWRRRSRNGIGALTIERVVHETVAVYADAMARAGRPAPAGPFTIRAAPRDT